jgi:hypothetical protein
MAAPTYSAAVPIIVEGQEHNRPSIHHKAPGYHAKLWRYMRREQFERMLEERGILLWRANSFSDQLEGTLSPANLSKRPYVYRDNPVMEQAYWNLVCELGHMKQWTYVSCWRVDEEEHARSWREYPKSADAVALQTTYQLIARKTGCIFCACVEYVEHGSTWIVEGNSLMPFIHKDKQYDWEKEFRIIIQRFPRTRRGTEIIYDCAEQNPSCGLVLGVDLSQLIERIVISPTASLEAEGAIRSLVEQHALTSRVERSAFRAVTTS